MSGNKAPEPQGSIIRSPLFIMYVNDLCDVYNVCKAFESIMFADDSNLFSFTQKHKRTFSYCQLGTKQCLKWFNAEKLPLNKNKTKFTLFHKDLEKDNIPIQLASLFKTDREIKRITVLQLNFWKY